MAHNDSAATRHVKLKLSSLPLGGLMFALTVAFWNTLDHTSSTPKWALLSVALPSLALLCRPKWSPAYLPAIGFLVLVWVSALWGPPLDSWERAWRFTVLGLAFWIGLSVDEDQYRYAVYGVISGLGVNAAILSAQRLGWDFLKAANDPGALFFNGTFLADAIAIGLVGFLGLHFSWVILGLGVASIVLAGGKAGILAITLCGALYAVKRQVWAALFILVMVVLLGVLASQVTNSLDVRLPLWVNSLSIVSIWGEGAGAFPSVYPTIFNKILLTDPGIFSATVRPQTAHNDLITIGVEFGLVGVALYVSIIGAALRAPVTSRADRSAHYGLWAFLFLGLVNFPLFMPFAAVPAFFAGYLSRHWGDVRLLDYTRGIGVWPRRESG